MRGGRAWAFRIAAAPLSASLALVACEVVCRLIDTPRQHIYSVAEPTGDQYAFYQFDPVLGWSNTPNAHGTFRRGEFSFPLRINAHGMRDRDPSPAPSPDRPRVAVLGDSFVWGIGVADEERFTDLLRESTGRDVLNFGVSGYAPVQYWLLLDRILAFRPHMVIVGVCLNNDFGDNVLRERYGYCKPYARLDGDGRIVIDGYPLPNVKEMPEQVSFVASPLERFLYDHSALARRCLARAARVPGGGDVQAGLIGFEDELIYRDPSTLSAEERRLRDTADAVNQALLAEIRDRLRAAGVELILLAVPTKREYPPAGGRDRRAADVLRETARALQVAFVDPVDAMSRSDFWEFDGHWNPAGHRKVAAALRHALGASTRGAAR